MTYFLYRILNFFFTSYIYDGYENVTKVDRRDKSRQDFGLLKRLPFRFNNVLYNFHFRWIIAGQR